MPKVAKGRRKRAYGPKTRSGCLTCKARRVKCDETRPECLRCTSTRRVCDGYPHMQTIDSLGLSEVPLAFNIEPSADIHPCAISKRSFEFFTRRTSPQLAGFFGSAFWERLVLQAAHHEPAIRYAITAIGSLHERAIIGKDLETTFALQQYNLAIRSLLAPLGQQRKQGVDVCLISCILFICFENMQGHHVMAESHIQSGSRLLQELVRDQQNDALQYQTLGSARHIERYVPFEQLAAIFAVLDNQVAKLVQGCKSTACDKCSTGMVDNDTPFVFSTIEEARDMFEYCLYLFTSNNAVRESSDTAAFPELLQAHVDYSTVLVEKFSSALRSFMHTRGPFITARDRLSVTALQLHVLNSYVSFLVEHLPPAYRPHTNTLLPQMKEMVSLGEEIVAFISGSTEFDYQRTSFCLDIGYIIPLYTVASQCQDITTRRRAIALLRSTSRQEGLWNSLVVAKAAERILEIEENEGEQLMPCTLGAALPTSSSLSTVLQLDGRGVRLQYVKAAQDNLGTVPVVEEILTW